MSREPIPTYFFSLCVVRLGPRFLLVHERKHGQQWFFPGGRCEPGETLVEAARRETLEEAGVPIVIDGLVRLEHSPGRGHARVRAIFLAHPEDDTPPKSIADEHTLEAAWFSCDELLARRLPLRGEEVLATFRAVERGAPIAPLSLLCYEGAPW